MTARCAIFTVAPPDNNVIVLPWILISQLMSLMLLLRFGVTHLNAQVLRYMRHRMGAAKRRDEASSASASASGSHRSEADSAPELCLG
eukprot:scaffold443429_cov38-Prasinocladus_malaysianus.AAC.1